MPGQLAHTAASGGFAEMLLILGEASLLSRPTWLRFSASAKSLNHRSPALEPTMLTPLLTCKHKFKQDFKKLLTTPGKKCKS